MRKHPIWFGIGFGIIPFLVLVLGYINIHPELFRTFPRGFGQETSAPAIGIAWSADEKDDPPLEYISDSFAGLQIWTEVVEVRSFWSLWNRPKSEIEYKWEYKVKNISEDKRVIAVSYQLDTRDERVLKGSDGSEEAEPGETVTIEGKSRIPYHDARLVTNSSWRISYRVVP